MKTLIILIVLILPYWLYSQQIADTTYNPIIQNPEYQIGKGSVVFIDEGHNNFHTKNGRYKAFSNLLERDGYNVKACKDAFTKTEIEVVKKWVKDGGSLFLIADHMPMAGAAKDLAAEFGFEFTNGF